MSLNTKLINKFSHTRDTNWLSVLRVVMCELFMLSVSLIRLFVRLERRGLWVHPSSSFDFSVILCSKSVAFRYCNQSYCDLMNSSLLVSLRITDFTLFAREGSISGETSLRLLRFDFVSRKMRLPFAFVRSLDRLLISGFGLVVFNSLIWCMVIYLFDLLFLIAL